MADLPPLHHPRAKAFEGLPSHAASHWVSGKPIFSVDQRKMRILGVRQRCWQCGYSIAGRGYAVVTEADHNDGYGDLHTQAFGPLHRSCSLYAALACPYLRYPKSRRRLGDSSQRGTASILGFKHYGVFFPPSPITFICFGYFSATGKIQLTNQAHVADLYEQAVSDDAATGFTTAPRLYWTDSPADLRRLSIDWKHTRGLLQAWANHTITINGNTYCGRVIQQQQKEPVSA